VEQTKGSSSDKDWAAYQSIAGSASNGYDFLKKAVEYDKASLKADKEDRQLYNRLGQGQQRTDYRGFAANPERSQIYDEYNKETDRIANTKYELPALDLIFNDKLATGKRSIKMGYWVVRYANPKVTDKQRTMFVARELRKVSIKYSERPGYPLYASLGINKYVQILGSRLTSFGAEIYLLNNAGTYVPVDDGQLHSFSVIGNYVVPTGQHEYMDKTVNEFSAPEPAIFESMWIQNESDAKKLSQWIKTQWSKQQMIVNMEVFGNPLLSVGDVITINYPDNNLDGTGKFIITNVNLSYDGGLSTNITARSIYS
jgi:hypothetical protein